jgi:MarR-like DNA-binding transcriptional regulator SgrR of sgrS sRNA
VFQARHVDCLRTRVGRQDPVSLPFEHQPNQPESLNIVIHDHYFISHAILKELWIDKIILAETRAKKLHKHTRISDINKNFTSKKMQNWFFGSCRG